jgi:uncharacterized protein YneR
VIFVKREHKILLGLIAVVIAAAAAFGIVKGIQKAKDMKQDLEGLKFDPEEDDYWALEDE